MVQRIKIVESNIAGSVVNQVNELLAKGWQLLSEHAVFDRVPEDLRYVVYLTREDMEA